jgi:hypothetical protein
MSSGHITFAEHFTFTKRRTFAEHFTFTKRRTFAEYRAFAKYRAFTKCIRAERTNGG